MNTTVDLNVASYKLPVLVHYVQHSTEIPIDFIIHDYEIPSGATARFYLRKPSGNEVYNDCTISGNTVTLQPSVQTFAEKGLQKAQLQLMIEDKFLISFPLDFDVAENIIDDSAIESSNEYGALESLLQEAQTNIPAAGEAATAANQAAEAANTAAGAANQAAENADSATTAAANAASAAATAAGQANTAAGAANTAAGEANTARDSANTAASAANQAAQNANDTAAAVQNQLCHVLTTSGSDRCTARRSSNMARENSLPLMIRGISTRILPLIPPTADRPFTTPAAKLCSPSIVGVGMLLVIVPAMACICCTKPSASPLAMLAPTSSRHTVDGE